jgi:hypothetical protein
MSHLTGLVNETEMPVATMLHLSGWTTTLLLDGQQLLQKQQQSAFAERNRQDTCKGFLTT